MTWLLLDILGPRDPLAGVRMPRVVGREAGSVGERGWEVKFGLRSSDTGQGARLMEPVATLKARTFIFWDVC